MISYVNHDAIGEVYENNKLTISVRVLPKDMAALNDALHLAYFGQARVSSAIFNAPRQYDTAADARRNQLIVATVQFAHEKATARAAKLVADTTTGKSQRPLPRYPAVNAMRITVLAAHEYTSADSERFWREGQAQGLVRVEVGNAAVEGF